MISSWLVRFLGTIGTAALLLAVALGYFIWQFNPAFNLPKGKRELATQDTADNELAVEPVKAGKTINDLYNESSSQNLRNNSAKTEGPLLMITSPEVR